MVNYHDPRAYPQWIVQLLYKSRSKASNFSPIILHVLFLHYQELECRVVVYRPTGSSLGELFCYFLKPTEP